VLEAWAARRPVVAFAVGGPLYLIENRVTGVLVPPGDVDALSDAVKELMEDGGLAENLASNGYDHAQDFTPDRIYSDLRGAIGIYL
jgi:glycosyltransferase involved in cell wall biosynthesis